MKPHDYIAGSQTSWTWQKPQTPHRVNNIGRIAVGVAIALAAYVGVCALSECYAYGY